MHPYLLPALCAGALAAISGLSFALYRVWKQHRVDVAHQAAYRARKKAEIAQLKEKLRLVNMTLGGAGGGVFHRIADNRDLVETLIRHHPELLKQIPALARGLADNQHFFTKLCDVLEFRNPNATLSGSYRATALPDPFWISVKAGEIDKLNKQLPTIPQNPNRCAACLGSDSLGSECAAAGVCGGCGKTTKVYDLEAIAAIEEFTSSPVSQEVAPAPDVRWSMD